MAASKFWSPFDLLSGCQMPAIGFGALPATNDKETTMKQVDYALKVGYRSFETTALSKTQVLMGEALREILPKYDLVRDDIFVSAKLYNVHHRSTQQILNGFDRSESALSSPPDMFILDFPTEIAHKAISNKIHIHAAWGALTTLYNSGRVSSTGVANLTVRNLKKLQQEFHNDIPMLNQIEWNPLHHDEGLLNFCNGNAIVVQGSHSLGDTSKSLILKHSLVKEIADDCAALSSAQVLLSWSLQRGVAVIPKSTNVQHIAQNINLNFSLNSEQMNALDHFKIEPLKVTKSRYHVF